LQTVSLAPTLVRWTFLIFVFSIPFEAIDLGFASGALSPAKLAGLPFFLATCLYFRSSFRRPPVALWFFVGYLLTYILGGVSLTGDLFDQYISRLLTLVQLILLLALAYPLLKSRGMARQALLTYSFAAVGLAAGVLLRLPGFEVETETALGTRFSALGYNPNDLSAVIAVAIIALIGIPAKTVWRKSMLLLLSLPLLMVLVQTSSRAGVAALGFGCLMYFCPVGKLNRRWLTVLLAIIAIIGLTYFVAQDPVFRERWSLTYKEGNTAGRDRIFKGALELIVEKPWQGWRPVEFLYHLADRIGADADQKDAHNLFLHLLLEVGLMGTVPFVIGFGLCFKSAWNGRRGILGILPLSLLTTVLAINLAHTWLARKPMWLALSLALAAGSREMSARHAPVHATASRQRRWRWRPGVAARSSARANSVAARSDVGGRIPAWSRALASKNKDSA